MALGGGTLFAAWRAAHWAKKAAEHTASSVTEAQRSAQAAEEALTETRNAYALQMRPYVAFTDSAKDEEQKPLGRDGHIKFAVRNFGQIPARNVRFSYGYYICPRPIGQAYANLGKPEAMGTIAPGDQRGATIYLADLPLAEYGRIASGKEVMILRAQVGYDLPNGADTDEIIVLVTDRSLRTGIIHTISDYERQRTANDDKHADADG